MPPPVPDCELKPQEYGLMPEGLGLLPEGLGVKSQWVAPGLLWEPHQLEGVETPGVLWDPPTQPGPVLGVAGAMGLEVMSIGSQESESSTSIC